ncbi:MAG: hypothetical protein PHQ98_02180 [Candidatus ainarchaeum sp.]|nr:hypothetical protein [Candidatus ainarchaeum sp.]
MSIYSPRPNIGNIIPKIKKPSLNNGGISDLITSSLGIVVILILIFAIAIVAINYFVNLTESNAIGVRWKNNPLDLTKDPKNNAELILTLINNSKDTKNLELIVDTKSNELIIYCPTKSFENVEAGNYREVSCIVRRDPNRNIYSGEYSIQIKTNLSDTKTILKVIAN